MRANDAFTYLKNNRVSLEATTVMRTYYPVMGADAFVLYHYFLAFQDDGVRGHTISEVLNHTLLGLQSFEQALLILTALDLVAVYKESDSYVFFLKQPLSQEAFLAHPAYRRLLERHIGDVALSELDLQIPEKAKDLSKTFADVFDLKGNIDHQALHRPKTTFDLEVFQQLMGRDNLRFANETEDVIALYHLAEKYQLSLYDTYQLAKETASQSKIMPQRMQAKKEQDQKQGLVQDDFSPDEKVVLQEAKAASPELFLAKIKTVRHAVITADERQLLDHLAQMGFLDEVINVMVLYTLTKTKSANLNKRYVMKIANDFAYQKVKRAEDAILKMRSFDHRKKESKANPKASNVPEWSQADYKNETTQDEQAHLEELKRQTLARLERGE